jgi:hypothetical protein
MLENQDIAENPEDPAVIPDRPLRPSEILELKIITRETKDRLSWLMGTLKTANFQKRLPTDEGMTYEIGPDEIEEVLNDCGSLCDKITEYCRDELKKLDEGKKKKRKV